MLFSSECNYRCGCYTVKYPIGGILSVLILGSGLSGVAVFDWLKSRGVLCKFASNEFLNSESLDDELSNRELSDVDYVVISPGIPLNKNAILEVKNKNIPIISELEFAFSKISNDVIAVTGTNGKTTVVNLINFLLIDSTCGSVMCGNVGIPLTSKIDSMNNEVVVLECSSFQLESVNRFSPHIAVILNITEDHLNRHKTMKNYIRCKYNITKKQTVDDYLILNADDEMIMKNIPKTKAKIYYFSLNKKVEGVYLKGNTVYFYNNKRNVKLIVLKDIKIKGKHNLSNILASILVVYLQTGNLDLLKKVSLFQGVEHRIEFVLKIRGVSFYNDSKSTNISSTLVACDSFEGNINLILGGYDKGFEFDELFKNLNKNVKNIAIIGENKNKIALSALKYNFNNYKMFDNLETAVKFLFDKSKKGDVVLLSPASASFDQFANFEQRGEFFKKFVFNLK